MKGLLTTLFVIWVVWKLVKPALDRYLQEAQRRMDEQLRKEQPPGASLPGTPPAGSTTVHKDTWELGEPLPGEEGKIELEQWFREALKRKRRLGEAPDFVETPPRPVPTRAREVAGPVSPSPRQPRVVDRQTAPRRVEPRPAEPRRRRREARTEPRRVIVPREAAVATAGTRHAKERPERRRETAGPRRIVSAGIPCIGALDSNDVRRGIILAEILGPPKALRDIDSHVV